jgi:hypothetical protein
MKFITKLFIILLPIFMLGQAKVGTSAAPFLGIDVGASGSALGGSQVAVANDASAIYWNPGATAQLENSRIQFSDTQWLVGTKFNFGAIVLKLSSSDALGFSYTSLDYGREEVTDELHQEGAQSYWEASDLAVSINYARMLTDRFSIGGTAKMIQTNIWHESASAFALDIGVLFKTQLDGFQIGMSIANFGPDMMLDGPDLLKRIDLDPDNTGNNETLVAKLKVDSYPLPLFFRLGVAHQLKLGSFAELTVLADAFVPSDNVEVFNVGTEFSLYKILFLRAGLKNIGYEESNVENTFGAGVKFNVNQMDMMLNYSLQDYLFFGLIRTYSLEVSF